MTIMNKGRKETRQWKCVVKTMPKDIHLPENVEDRQVPSSTKRNLIVDPQKQIQTRSLWTQGCLCSVQYYPVKSNRSTPQMRVNVRCAVLMDLAPLKHAVCWYWKGPPWFSKTPLIRAKVGKVLHPAKKANKHLYKTTKTKVLLDDDI